MPLMPPTPLRTLDVGVCSMLIEPIVLYMRNDSRLPCREFSGDVP